MSNDQMATLLAGFADLELAVIIGSQANGTARPGSDWDIALQWSRSLTFTEQLAATEHLRSLLARELNVPLQSIDLMENAVGKSKQLLKAAENRCRYRHMTVLWGCQNSGISTSRSCWRGMRQ